MSAVAPDSWWRRNWKWFVPVGCLGVLVLSVLSIALLFWFIAGAIRQSDAHSQALSVARADEQVVAALGTPIETGWFTSGSINVDGSSGNADLSIPLAGPKGEATLYVVAEKTAGEWGYRTLVVELAADGRRIDLLAPQP